MNKRKDRRLRVRALHREEPDLQRLGRAVLALAEAQLEAEAQAAHEQQATKGTSPPPATDTPKDAA